MNPQHAGVVRDIDLQKKRLQEEIQQLERELHKK